MSLFISIYFGENTIINATADFNLVNYLKKLDESKKKKLKIYFIDLKKFKKIINNLNNNDLIIYFKEKYNFEIKNIIFFDHYHRVQVQTLSCKNKINIYHYLIDCHDNKDLLNYKYEYYNNNNKYKLLATYAYNLKAANPNANELKFNYFFPHSVLYKIEFNNNPFNNILLCGRGMGNPDRYPYRVKMNYISNRKENNFIHYFKNQTPYRVHIDDKRCFGNNFIKYLNNYKIVFCDDGNIKTNFNYIFAKFFEIMSTGALLLTHNKNTKRYFEKLGFKDGEDYLTIDLDNDYDKIRADLINLLSTDNSDKINKIRLSGYEKVWKYHSCEQRLNDLFGIINNSIEYIEYDDGISGTKYLSKKYI